MPYYEVKFEIFRKTELTKEETDKLAANIYSRMSLGGARPEHKTVHVIRQYQPHEEREIVVQHAQRDLDAHKDWNDASHGCACSICRTYRNLGMKVVPDKEILMPPIPRLREEA